MIAVAIISIVLGSAVKLKRRSTAFRHLSDYHRGQIRYVFCGPYDQNGEWIGQPSVFDQDMHSVTGVPRHKALWHVALSRKYERAARSPWFPVAPDPPEPK